LFLEKQKYSRPELANLISRIRQGDLDAVEELYQMFSNGIRHYFVRQLGPLNLDERIHDCLLIVVNSIRQGELHEPERLISFVRLIVQGEVVRFTNVAAQQRQQEDYLKPDASQVHYGISSGSAAILDEQANVASDLLKALSTRDREILTRFYLEEQTEEAICREMKLTTLQFRTAKSLARSRLGDLGKRKLSRYKSGAS
jgi:RNA polymerase sigma-70 factor, ECF subfamily